MACCSYAGQMHEGCSKRMGATPRLEVSQSSRIVRGAMGKTCVLRLVWVGVFWCPFALYAQSASDAAAVRQLPHAFAAAWGKHDGHQLAQIMADDVDFVNVGGDWLQGPASIRVDPFQAAYGQIQFDTDAVAGKGALLAPGSGGAPLDLEGSGIAVSVTRCGSLGWASSRCWWKNEPRSGWSPWHRIRTGCRLRSPIWR